MSNTFRKTPLGAFKLRSKIFPEVQFLVNRLLIIVFSEVSHLQIFQRIRIKRPDLRVSSSLILG